MSYTYEYPHMALTVDVVLFDASPATKVLLIQRGIEPFKGAWALPGGFVQMDESIITAAARELHEETGIKAPALEFLSYHDALDRDPRERTVAFSFIGTLSGKGKKAVAGDDAADAQWHMLDALPPLAFDHGAILHMAIEKARAAETSKLSFADFKMMPVEDQRREIQQIQPDPEAPLFKAIRHAFLTAYPKCKDVGQVFCGQAAGAEPITAITVSTMRGTRRIILPKEFMGLPIIRTKID